MAGAQKDGTISGQPQIFARNLLVVMVPATNPAGINAVHELATAMLKLVLTHKDVPVGNYAHQALAKMTQDPAYGQDFSRRVLGNFVCEETHVRQVASKVQLGEADAGTVYSTNVTPAIRLAVRVIQIPPEFNVIAVIAKCLIAAVNDTRNAASVRAFIEYVLSPVGQAILSRNGFLVGGSYCTACWFIRSDRQRDC